MPKYTLRVAGSQHDPREPPAAQLDADGHTVYTADDTSAVIATLAARAIDVVLLADLQHPRESPALVRRIRAGRHHRVHCAQPIITFGAADEVAAVRAYEAGSDHHLPGNAGYLLVRSVMFRFARTPRWPRPSPACSSKPRSRPRCGRRWRRPSSGPYRLSAS